jgi:hypothetical protein
MPKQQQKYQSIKLYHHLISKINQYIELERKKKKKEKNNNNNYLHDYFINIISNQRSLLPRSLIKMVVHVFDPALNNHPYQNVVSPFFF